MMYVPGQNAHEEMVSIADHYKKRIAELEAENERLRRPACGTEQVWLDTIRHDDEQALLWFRAMQRESELKKEAMKDADQLTDTFDRIKHWCAAYPINVFIEPDWKAVDAALKDAGLNLAAVSGSNMRHVVDGIQRIIDATTKVSSKHD